MASTGFFSTISSTFRKFNTFAFLNRIETKSFKAFAAITSSVVSMADALFTLFITIECALRAARALASTYFKIVLLIACYLFVNLNFVADATVQDIFAKLHF